MNKILVGSTLILDPTHCADTHAIWWQKDGDAPIKPRIKVKVHGETTDRFVCKWLIQDQETGCKASVNITVSKDSKAILEVYA